jgi:hypothetical protein
MRHAVCSLAAIVLAAGAASAQVRINEIFVNPPGTDQGLEFIEIKSDTPNFSLAGLTLVIVEGDNGAQGLAGTIDQALDLGAFSTGSNRLFLWRDGSATLSPAPEPETVINVADFNPDIENGGNTYFLVTGFTGAVGIDLDTDNDGTLDSMPWATVIDSFGYREAVADPQFSLHRVYASLDLSSGPDLWTPDTVLRIGTTTWALDVLGTGVGPWTADPFEIASFPAGGTLPVDYQVTPGRQNPGDDVIPPCPADFNGVDGVTVQDIFDYLADWSSQVGGGSIIIASADFNGTDGVTVQDIFDFLAAWSTGCP